tara:strand:- start:1401 stop:1580 length:180 start_codon:yes stop_codon:yes gene_type:complete
MGKEYILINKIDVKMREIQNFDNQFDVLCYALGNIDNKQLKNILSYANSKLKQDKQEKQ